MTLEHQRIPPTINYDIPDPTIQLRRGRANKARDARVTAVMSNSFGFGGQNASLILTREPIWQASRLASMNRLLLRAKARIRDAAKPFGEAAVGALTIGMLRTTRYFDPVKTANLFGRITRFIGRRLRENRIGRANLTAAFPEKSPEEIEAILAGVWDNLGRVGAEFAHLDHIWDYDLERPGKQPHRVLDADQATVRSDQGRRQAGVDFRRAISATGNCRHWRR